MKRVVYSQRKLRRWAKNEEESVILAGIPNSCPARDSLQKHGTSVWQELSDDANVPTENTMTLKMTFEDLCADAKTRITEVSADDVQAVLNDPSVTIIDVRENDEFRAGHMPGAKGIGRGVLEYHIADEVPNTDTPIVLYCRGGNRSALAADSLQRMGYTNVSSMKGGWRQWSEEGRPVSFEGDPIKH